MLFDFFICIVDNRNVTSIPVYNIQRNYSTRSCNRTPDSKRPRARARVDDLPSRASSLWTTMTAGNTTVGIGFPEGKRTRSRKSTPYNHPTSCLCMSPRPLPLQDLRRGCRQARRLCPKGNPQTRTKKKTRTSAKRPKLHNLTSGTTWTSYVGDTHANASKLLTLANSAELPSPIGSGERSIAILRR